MRLFTKQEIDLNRKGFESKFPQAEAQVAGLQIPYFVMPQSLDELTGFVYRCTSSSPDDGFVFGIADSVPEASRPFAIYHEFTEFMEIGIHTQGRCVQALERELQEVPKDKLPVHLRERFCFFRGLIPYCESRPEVYTSADLEEMRGSLERLEMECSRYWPW